MIAELEMVEQDRSKVGQTMHVSELLLRDVVRIASEAAEADGYTSSTVIQVTDDEVGFFRPYTHTSDVVYSGGQVIAYVGAEKYTVLKKHSNLKYKLLHRERYAPQ